MRAGRQAGGESPYSVQSRPSLETDDPSPGFSIDHAPTYKHDAVRMTPRHLKFIEDEPDRHHLKNSLRENKRILDLLEQQAQNAMKRREQLQLMHGFFPWLFEYRLSTIGALVERKAYMMSMRKLYANCQIDRPFRRALKRALKMGHFLSKQWAWAQFIHYTGVVCKAELAAKARALKAWQRWEEMRALQRWIASHDETLRTNMLQHRAASCLFMRRSRRAWITWQVNARNRRVMRASLKSLAGACGRRGLNAWVARAHQQRHTQRLVRKSLSAFVQRNMRMACNAWMIHAVEHGAFRRSLKLGVSALLKRQERLGFTSWREYAMTFSDTMRQLKRGVSGFRSAKSRKCINHWVQFAIVRSKAVRSLAALKHRGKRSGFNSWAGAGAACREKGRLIRTAVSSWRREGPRRAWLKWHALVVHCLTLSMALHTMIMRGKRTGLNSWIELTWERRERARLMRSGVAALLMRQERLGFTSWRELVDTRLEMRDKLKKGVSIFRSRPCRKCFNQWVHVATQRRTVTNALMSMKQRGKRIGFNSWACFCRTLAARRVTISLALRSMIMRGKRTGMNSWIDLIRGHRESVRLTRSGVAALLMRQERLGFWTWRELAAMHSETMRKLKQGVSIFGTQHARRSERLAWNSWVIAHANGARSARGVLLTITERARKGLRQTWLTWRSQVFLQQTILTSMRVTFARHCLSRSRRGFDSWRVFAVTQRAGHRLMYQSVQWQLSGGRPVARAAMTLWRVYAAAQSRLLRTFAFSGSALSNRQQRRSLRVWRRLMPKRVAGSQLVRLRYALRVWLTFRRLRIAVVLQLQSTFARMAELGANRVQRRFDSWRKWNEVRRAISLLKPRSVRVMAQRVLKTATGKWRAYAAVQAVISRLVAFGGPRHNLVRSRHAVRKWGAFARSRGARKRQIWTGVVASSRRRLMRCIRTWLNLVRLLGRGKLHKRLRKAFRLLKTFYIWALTCNLDRITPMHLEHVQQAAMLQVEKAHFGSALQFRRVRRRRTVHDAFKEWEFRCYQQRQLWMRASRVPLPTGASWMRASRVLRTWSDWWQHSQLKRSVLAWRSNAWSSLATTANEAPKELARVTTRLTDANAAALAQIKDAHAREVEHLLELNAKARAQLHEATVDAAADTERAVQLAIQKANLERLAAVNAAEAKAEASKAAALREAAVVADDAKRAAVAAAMEKSVGEALAEERQRASLAQAEAARAARAAAESDKAIAVQAARVQAEQSTRDELAQEKLQMALALEHAKQQAADELMLVTRELREEGNTRTRKAMQAMKEEVAAELRAVKAQAADELAAAKKAVRAEVEAEFMVAVQAAHAQGADQLIANARAVRAEGDVKLASALKAAQAQAADELASATRLVREEAAAQQAAAVQEAKDQAAKELAKVVNAVRAEAEAQHAAVQAVLRAEAEADTAVTIQAVREAAERERDAAIEATRVEDSDQAMAMAAMLRDLTGDILAEARRTAASELAVAVNEARRQLSAELEAAHAARLRQVEELAWSQLEEVRAEAELERLKAVEQARKEADAISRTVGAAAAAANQVAQSDQAAQAMVRQLREELAAAKVDKEEALLQSKHEAAMAAARRETELGNDIMRAQEAAAAAAEREAELNSRVAELTSQLASLRVESIRSREEMTAMRELTDDERRRRKAAESDASQAQLAARAASVLQAASQLGGSTAATSTLAAYTLARRQQGSKQPSTPGSVAMTNGNGEAASRSPAWQLEKHDVFLAQLKAQQPTTPSASFATRSAEGRRVSGASLFDTIDANGDGVVSREELTAFMAHGGDGARDIASISSRGRTPGSSASAPFFRGEPSSGSRRD